MLWMLRLMKRKRNGLFYSKKEETINSISHGIGIAMGVIVSTPVSYTHLLCQHIGQDIRQIGLIIFQQFMASYPIFRTLIGHSDTFSGNAFETVQMGRDNLLFPFQGRNDSYCQRMVRSRLCLLYTSYCIIDESPEQIPVHEAHSLARQPENFG